MKTSFTASAVTLSAFALSASAAEPAWRSVPLDPTHEIRPALLAEALASYETHAKAGLRPDVIGIVDFAQSSAKRRFYLVDLATGTVTSFLVAHGRGSDTDHNGHADSFSNDDGSHASSLGGYRTGARYMGLHGLSLALDGLDSSNSAARARTIVIHSEWYVSEKVIAAQGKPGRSWGCFVVDPAVITEVVERLEGGRFIFAGT